MHLYLIRHAESQNNVLRQDMLHQRKVDPDLTPLGYQQRDALAESMAREVDGIYGRFAITHLYTSAMLRSLLTTEPLSRALDLRPSIWTDVHEKGGMFQRKDGQVEGFPGLTRAEIGQRFPNYDMPATVTERGWYDARMAQEPEIHSFYRAMKVARALRQRSHSDEVIAMVSHAGFLDVLLKAIFDQLPGKPHCMRYYHQNTAITRINYDEGPALVYMNRCDHLPANLRSR